MKILFVSSYFGYKSGFNKASGDILYALLQSDNKVAVVTHYAYIKLPVKSKKKFKLIKAPWCLTKPVKIKYGNLILWMRWLFRKYQDIYRKNYIKEVFKYNPDLVIINSYGYYLLNGFDFSTIKSTFISHGSVDSSKLSKDPRYNVINTILLMEKFDNIIYVSDIVKQQWSKYAQIKNKKSFYIPNCANEITAQILTKIEKKNIAAKINFNQDRFNIVCVANIGFGKGQDLIINNFSKYIKQLPGVVFHFIGDYSDEFGAKLIKTISKSKLNDYIIFHGVKKNAMDYIYAANLFILPSRGEAFPLVVLEAMILKTPIIASAIGGIPEMIEDGISGLLFEAGETTELWSSIIRLFSSEALRIKLSENALTKYISCFSRTQQVHRFKEYLTTIAI